MLSYSCAATDPSNFQYLKYSCAQKFVLKEKQGDCPGHLQYLGHAVNVP